MNPIRRLQQALIACLFFLPGVMLSQTSSTGWSIAALDQILSNVPPGQATAQVGDMQILVSNLRAWRNQLAGVPQPKLAFDGTAPTWPGGNVYYHFDSSVSPAEQQAVLDGAAEWATFANLHFIPRTAEANYITFRQNNSLGGGQSAVGMIGGEQFTEFGPNAWNRNTICHEIGHALGLVHEQQRSDRDSYVTIITTNISPSDMGNFVLLSNSQNQGPYDFLSVMHYSRNSFPINPSINTIEPLPQYAAYLNIMGTKFDPVLSTSDRAGMAAIYGSGPAQTNTVSNTRDSGTGSLRAALYYAIDHPSTTIAFNISSNDVGFSNNLFNITLTDVLPSVLNNTMLDATTQPDNSVTNRNVRLASVSPPVSGTFPNGMRFHGTNSAIKGLTISGFPGAGVRIEQGGSSNIIGGPLANDRNIISGNGQQGVAIFSSTSSGNVIRGNFIGLNSAGDTKFSNTWEGVAIFDQSPGNLVVSNVISGNGAAGIRLDSARSNSVQGNIIGLNAAGTASIPNAWSGVFVLAGAQSNLIGGPLTSQRNVISGNSAQGLLITDANTIGNIVQGNFIGLNPTGNSAISNNSDGLAIYSGAQNNSALQNVISGNTFTGIAIFGGAFNRVQGNLIGLDVSGTIAIPNSNCGVLLLGGAQSNLVGGTTVSTRNIISGNLTQGIAISDSATSGNTISGNFIGTDLSGTLAISNGYAGISIYSSASLNVIGGQKPGSGNIISGNGNQGLTIDGSGTTNNSVWGNFIGLNAAGTGAIPNAWSGIAIFNGAQSNLIGGTTVSQRNVISGNALQGVVVADPGTSGNVISGNSIGLNAAGTVAVPNQWPAVNFFNSPSGNTIGGSQIGAGNVICGNASLGIVIQSGSSNNAALGNFIGINPAGSLAFPNGDAGIGLWDGAVANQIGGVNPGEANVIANNSWDAVQLFDAATTNNTIRGNSSFANSGAGIALYTGANLAFPPPSLTSAVMTTNIEISGTYSGLPNTTFKIDFYSSAAPAQGMVYLGSKDMTTAGGGSGIIDAFLPIHLPVGRIITATATDTTGNTSAMSTGVNVTATSSVNDSIPDAWRALYFGGDGSTTNSQTCATCDADQDGVNNQQEFLAGTNPTNTVSLLKLTALSANPSNTVARFPSVIGSVYQLQTRDDLGTGLWSIAVDQIPGTGTNIFLADPNAPPSKRFYRLQVLW